MTPSYDPPRFASGRADAPDSLREALKAAASDGPGLHEIEKLAGALAPIFAAPPSTFPDAAPHGISESAGAGLGAGKVATLLSVAVLVGAGGYAAWRHWHASDPGTQNIAPAVRTQSDPAPALQPPEPIAAPALPLETPAPVAAPVPAKPREAVRSRPVEAPAQETPAQPAAKAQLSESELVELARKSVTGDPRNALSLVQEHHRRFAGGPLSEEADFIEIEAMKRLGRFEEARALDDRFRKRYPTSIHGQTVQVRPAPSP
jgi:hypothetical protein